MTLSRDPESCCCGTCVGVDYHLHAGGLVRPSGLSFCVSYIQRPQEALPIDALSLNSGMGYLKLQEWPLQARGVYWSTCCPQLNGWSPFLRYFRGELPLLAFLPFGFVGLCLSAPVLDRRAVGDRQSDV